MIKVKGRYLGELVEVSWDNGKIYGDPMVILEVKNLASRLRGELINLIHSEDHLSNKNSFVTVAKRVLVDPEVVGKLDSLKLKPGTVR